MTDTQADPTPEDLRGNDRPVATRAVHACVAEHGSIMPTMITGSGIGDEKFLLFLYAMAVPEGRPGGDRNWKPV